MMKEIFQKRFPVQTEFRFDAETLYFAHIDPTGRHAFAVPYTGIPFTGQRETVTEVRSSWYQNMAAALSVVAFFQLIFGFMPQRALATGALLGSAALLYVIYRLSARRYTVIPTEVGALYVLDDEQKADIIAELELRRDGELRRQYAEIDFSNDFMQELYKFGWLLQQGIITQEEYDAAKHQLMFAHANWVPLEPKHLN